MHRPTHRPKQIHILALLPGEFLANGILPGARTGVRATRGNLLPGKYFCAERARSHKPRYRPPIRERTAETGLWHWLVS